MTKEREQKRNDEDFTTRAVMSLVLESSELMQAAQRFSAVVAALAIAHGVSTKV